MQPTQEELLNLSRNSFIFVLLLGIAFVSSWLLAKNRVRTVGVEVFGSYAEKAEAHISPWYKSFHHWQFFVFLFVSTVVAMQVTQFSLLKLVDRESLEPTLRLFSGLLRPNWEVLPKAVLKMVETMFLAFLATALAVPIAFVLCFFCAKNIMQGPIAFAIYLFLRTLLNVTRSIEAFIWAIIFSVWVGIGPFAGMLALMIHSIVSLAKQYSEIVENVEDGPIEGIKSTGANQVQTIWFAVVPQVVLPFISFTVYRWDINIRMATIVGFVGGGGIGSLLQMYQGQAMWPEVGTIIFVIAFVVWFMDTTSAYVREALK